MIMIEDWRPPIVEMVMVKRDLAAVDLAGVFPNHLPAVAATEDRIRAAERALAISLDGEHRTFLGFADGWRCFHQHVTLLGTGELVAGPLRDAASEAFLHAPEALDDLGLSSERVLPVAASLEQADVFVMPIEGGIVGPPVHWLAEGEVVDTFESFGEYFVSMIDYTRRRVAKLREAG